MKTVISALRTTLSHNCSTILRLLFCGLRQPLTNRRQRQFGAVDFWTRGSLDTFFELAAADELRFMLVSITDGSTFAPYDGGADATFPTSWQRDAVRKRLAGWLSAHPEGL